MKINRYLLAINLIFFVILGISYLRISVQTSIKESEFVEGYMSSNMPGSLEYLRIFEFNPAEGVARVFVVENMPAEPGKKNSKNYQVGRMLIFTEDKQRSLWVPSKKYQPELYWSDQKKSGNKFTFPPYVGRDMSILLKR